MILSYFFVAIACSTSMWLQALGAAIRRPQFRFTPAAPRVNGLKPKILRALHHAEMEARAQRESATIPIESLLPSTHKLRAHFAPPPERLRPIPPLLRRQLYPSPSPAEVQPENHLVTGFPEKIFNATVPAAKTGIVAPSQPKLPEQAIAAFPGEAVAPPEVQPATPSQQKLPERAVAGFPREAFAPAEGKPASSEVKKVPSAPALAPAGVPTAAPFPTFPYRAKTESTSNGPASSGLSVSEPKGLRPTTNKLPGSNVPLVAGEAQIETLPSEHLNGSIVASVLFPLATMSQLLSIAGRRAKVYLSPNHLPVVDITDSFPTIMNGGNGTDSTSLNVLQANAKRLLESLHMKAA